MDFLSYRCFPLRSTPKSYLDQVPIPQSLWLLVETVQILWLCSLCPWEKKKGKKNHKQTSFKRQSSFPLGYCSLDFMQIISVEVSHKVNCWFTAHCVGFHQSTGCSRKNCNGSDHSKKPLMCSDDWNYVADVRDDDYQILVYRML